MRTGVNNMKLVIQGLPEEEWKKIGDSCIDCTVIRDHGSIHPCIGCFSCWNRTPGKCVIHDGYQNLGSLIHHADEVIVLSRYTYGGFSGFVKNVFDRCLGYVLPMFEVVRGETHHKKRYPENKPFTFIFYGPEFSEEEKDSARKYVRAVCANIRGYVKAVEFRKAQAVPHPGRNPEYPEQQKALLLNTSVRHEKGNSAMLASMLEKHLHKETETVPLMKYSSRREELIRRLDEVPDLVICTPLYVDGLPSQLIRFMEQAEKEYTGRNKRVYVLANMGLYESSQLENLFSQIRQWCNCMGFEYCGGLGISAGELIGGITAIVPFGIGPSKTCAAGIKRLGKAIEHGEKIPELFAEPWKFPRSLYILIANVSWNRAAKRNGIRPKDMYRRL